MAKNQQHAPVNKKKKIKILLVDDHPVVRKGLGACLSSLDHVEVVAEAVDGQEAVDKVKELLPEIVLMDIDMPTMSGLEATKLIRKGFPGIKVLILSIHSNKDYVLQIIKSGAQGYVLKDAPLAELVRAIESVHGGGAFFSPDISQIMLDQYLAEATDGEEAGNSKKLTGREMEVLSMIAEGRSNKEMACSLGVGVRTVETHRERVMNKLDIHNVAGLTKYAIAHGIIKLEK
jgi:two-component system, NarL family, nitrate/nitrite response regulator NarL